MRTLYKFFLDRFLTCKDATRLVSEGRERRLNWRERLKLRMLCKMCPFTDRYKKQVEAVCDSVHHKEDCCEEALADKCLCDDAKKRIKQAVQSGN